MILISGDSNSTEEEVNIGPDGTFKPGGWVDTLTIISKADEVVRMGTTPGGNEIIDDTNVYLNLPRDVAVHQTFPDSATIYVTGNINPLVIKIHR